MKIILLLFVLGISLGIIFSKGSKRLCLLLIGIFFTYDCVIISQSPFLSAYTIIILSFILSLWKHKEFEFNWKNYPLNWITLCIIITVFIIGFLDSRLNLIASISRPIRDISETYLCFFIGYASIQSFEDWLKAQKYLLRIFVIMAIWGIITFVLQNNPWYDYVTSLYHSGETGIWSEVQVRGYRVSSFLSNPIVYGFLVSIVLIQFMSTRKIKGFNIVILILLFLNFILSNSRTSYAAALIAAAILYLLRYRYSTKVFVSIVLIFCFSLVAYNYFQPFTNMVNMMTDIFLTGGQNVGGSTTELKEMQWTASLYYFSLSPWFGNGLSYFSEVIMNSGSWQADYLAGMEGYAYKLLVEYGLIMIIVVMIFWGKALWFYKKTWNVNPTFASVNLSIIISFLFFICATGTYGSVFVYTSIILGMNMKQMRLCCL